MIVHHLHPERVSPDDDAHYFVGYYDKQPWSDDGTKLLAHRTTFCDRFPSVNDPCELGFIDLASRTFHPVATTHAWNYQQGAHLQWITLDGTECLLFNDRADDGTIISRAVDLSGHEVRRYPVPVYAVSADRTFALTLDFARLTRLRPEYGYPGLTDPHASDPAPSATGITRLDLTTGETTQLLSICDLARHDGLPDHTPHQHVNHIMINPSGTRACVLHRFDRPDGILASRLFTFDTRDGSDRRLLMSGMVSHYDWRDDQTLLAWAGRRALLGTGTERPTPKQRVMTLARKALKPVYYALGKPRILMNKIMKDSYLLIPDRSDAPTTPFARGELTCDGHCTYLRPDDASSGDPSNPRWVLTDGYPDLKSRQPLYLWDTNTNQGTEIGRFHTPRELDGELRVDLHPRFSPDGRAICIDSAMNGSRAIYTLDVSPITKASPA
jgi:hypothetical protein